MAKNDVQLIGTAGGVSIPTYRYKTELNTTVINPGEPCKISATDREYAVILADAEPIDGTTTNFLGVAATASTQTASADGEVYLHKPVAGLIYACKAKSAAAADTQAEIDEIIGDQILFDLTGTTFTVDTATAHNANNGCVIVGGDPARSVIYFTMLASSTNQ